MKMGSNDYADEDTLICYKCGAEIIDFPFGYDGKGNICAKCLYAPKEVEAGE